jgi:hypothetical protein
MKTIISVVCFLALSFPASAWPHLRKLNPIGFAKHHKLMLITAAIYLAADAADTQTTVNGLARCRTCAEGSDLFGKRPSAAKLWGISEAFNVGLVAMTWYGTSESDSMGTHVGWAEEEKQNHKALWWACWAERPVTVGVMAWGSYEHAHAAYRNAQWPRSH